MKKLLIINGPNLNMLGDREPEVYGTLSLADIENGIREKYSSVAELDFFQSNIEGEIIDRIHNAHRDQIDGIVINPGAYTHYALGIHDAVKAISVPVVEVHLTNIAAREEIRQKSVIAAATVGQISGFGFKSYHLGIEYFLSS